MNANPNPAKAIFLEAVERHAPDQWPAFLDRACAGQPELRGQVEALLGAHREVGTAQHRELAEGADPGPVATIDLPPVTETPGTVIGPYKLLERIGEGGFGVVYLAEQAQPVRRKVALKILKPGMDSRQVLARFETERQALAIMDHPNIAKVLDGGATPSGRPYFVMELVRGAPVNEYCDANHLTPRQRLELFVQVCQAVQHAHQKGIIHRDIKPSNVLVSRHDTQPVVKVIDFGVAKALGQKLTDKTLFTGLAQMVGTPLYMSPEQAGMSDLDVDTRSDIYSLGVLLYELLTGTTPFTAERFKRAGYDEIRRIIREEEPPKPSTRLSESKDSLPSVAAQRHTEPAKLTKLVRGELDWIVMKALEKDRNRRYETANGFAMDVQRYLAGEAVQAVPPSMGYRFKKFLRRNKGPVIAVSVILLCLVAGIVGTSAGLIWAVRERDSKAQALIAEAKARDQAMTALRNLVDDIVENQMARGTTMTEENKEFLRKIIKHFEGFAALTADDAESRAIRAEGHFRVGRMRYFLGEMKEAETAYADALSLYKQLVADFPDRPEFRRELGRCHHNLAQLWDKTDRLKEAEKGYADALAIQRPLVAEFPRPEFRQELARSHNSLGVLLTVTGRLEKAETAYGDALAIQKPLVAEFSGRPEFRWELASTHMNLGILFKYTNRPKDAETAYRDALAIQKKLADDFPKRPEFRRSLAASQNNLGILLDEMGRIKDAETAHSEALTILKHLTADFPTRPDFRCELARSHNNLGMLLMESSRLKEAETAYGDALAILKPLVTDFRNQREYREDLARTYNNLGNLLRRTGRLKDAETAYADALAVRRRLAADFPDQINYQIWLADTLSNLAELCNQRGDFNTAKAHQEGAIAAYRKAIELDPKDATAHYNLGVVLDNNGNLDEAIEAYRKAIKVDPKLAAAHGNLGLTLHKKGKLDEAIAACRKAIELDQKFANPHNTLGMCLSDQGKKDDAIAAYRKAIKADPKYANAHANLGSVFADQGKWDDAIAASLKAIELNSKHANAHTVVGHGLQAQGKPDEAITWHRKATEIDPRNGNAHYNFGIALKAQGKREEAILSLRKAVELVPKHPWAHRVLVELLVTSPDPKFRDSPLAVEHGKKAVELQPQDAFAWQVLGWAQYRAGAWRESIEALEQSCKLEAGTGDCGQWIVLALAHLRLAAQDTLPDKARELHRIEARRRYEDASKQIDGWGSRPGDSMRQAIWDFRIEARELMGVKDGKK